MLEHSFFLITYTFLFLPCALVCKPVVAVCRQEAWDFWSRYVYEFLVLFVEISYTRETNSKKEFGCLIFSYSYIATGPVAIWLKIRQV